VIDSCAGDSCITCSDAAIPATVIELLDGDLALVDTGDGVEEISVALVDAAVGDTLLVHAKEALGRRPT
jgi:hydrogenase maturation factor